MKGTEPTPRHGETIREGDRIIVPAAEGHWPEQETTCVGVVPDWKAPHDPVVLCWVKRNNGEADPQEIMAADCRRVGA